MGASTEIRKRISEELGRDGFSQPGRGIYVKPWDEIWRGWLTIDISTRLLGAVVGIFSKELVDMRARALQRLGSSHVRQPGPPLIMINLRQLSECDPATKSRISWTYTGKPLGLSVADDVVHCFRQNGYPYIDAHTSYAAVWDTVRSEGRISPAFPVYLPALLIRLGELELLPKLVESHKDRPVSSDISVNYAQYVRALLEQEGLSM